MRHYFDSLLRMYGKGTHKLASARKPLVEFCDVAEHTVQRWEGKKAAPVGSMAFRVMVFLSELGYEITEFERMLPAKKGVVELLAFRVISIGEILNIVGFSNETELYRFLRRDQAKRGDIERKIATAWELFVRNKGELDRRKEVFREKLGMVHVEEHPTLTESVITNKSTTAGEVAPRYPSHERPLLFSLCRILELQFRQLCADKEGQESLTKEERNAILQLETSAGDLTKRLFGEASDAK